MTTVWRCARITLVVVLACAASVPVHAQATSASNLSAEDFARRPTLRSPIFSPDGKKIAALGEYKGRMNLVVSDPDNGTMRQITVFQRFDVSGFAWISNKRIVLQTTDYQRGRGEDGRGEGLYAVDADGTDARTLSPAEDFKRVYFYQERIAGSDDDVLALSPIKGFDSLDLVRLNTRTGQYKVVSTDNPGYIHYWVVDKDVVPRAAFGRSADRKELIFWYRDTATAKWREMGRYPFFGRGTQPIQFGPDGTLYALSNLETDTAAVYKFDTAAGKLGERLLRHPLVDLTPVVNEENTLGTARSPLMLDGKSGEIVGLSVDADKPETYWFDERRARLQKSLDAALPSGNVNQIRSVGDKRHVVLSYADRDPGTFFLYDEDKRTLKELLRPRPWIKPEQMSAVQTLRYKARDGLEIPAYLTLPLGKEPKKLPLVAWIHGGPQARDEWGWDVEVQFFASRGYAVLQPNYRGSTGFGHKHLMAGAKQWGQAMQDDITDGIRHLIAQGIVDPNRVCIGGASYGGYATMAGLVKEPGLFKCGINVVGVTDLVWMHEIGYSDFQIYDPKGSDLFLDAMMDSKSSERAMLEANSPRLHASKIKAPVLIIHGGNDQRVPIKHAEGMRDALKAAGKPYEWLVFPEEGHGWNKAENVATYLKAMEAFLAKHLVP